MLDAFHSLVFAFVSVQAVGCLVAVFPSRTFSQCFQLAVSTRLSPDDVVLLYACILAFCTLMLLLLGYVTSLVTV